MTEQRKQCVFLSMESLDEYCCDDDKLYPAFDAAGIDVHTLNWRNERIDWNDYDWVIVRSSWDYQLDSERFFDVLERIDRSRAQLANPLQTMRWNANKRYLAELEQAGIPIVPTTWGTGITAKELSAHIDINDQHGLVIKPLVSAGAYNTFRLDRSSTDAQLDTAFKAHVGSDWMLQAFVPSILTHGEYSLFYFNGDYSHAINKRPVGEDFRVQEEFGGQISAIQPDEEMSLAGARALQQCSQDLLYARVDLVLHEDRYKLMELELIEPSLYFGSDPDSPERFLGACQRWFANN
ncbi:MAG: hypothetical protein AAF385_04900 [Pseudomonadota bacterium]